jgi:hypothetical protein
LKQTTLNISPPLTLLLFTLLLTACYAEGNSYYLSSGETEYFLTMNRCEKEAIAKYTNGEPMYSGYECRFKFLWFTTQKSQYYAGKLISETGQ